MSERRHNLAQRSLMDFFQSNPDEELTGEDAAAKLGISVRFARNMLASLSGSGLLDRTSVYRLRQPDPEPTGVRVSDVQGLYSSDAAPEDSPADRTTASAPGDPPHQRAWHPA